MARRVFITGFGIISAIGNGVEENFKSLTEKRSGIGKVSLLETSLSNYPVGEIKADSETLAKMGGIELSAIDSRTFLIGLIAAKEAVQMSGCEEYLSSMGLVGSNTVGGMDLNDRYYRNSSQATAPTKTKSFLSIVPMLANESPTIWVSPTISQQSAPLVPLRPTPS